MKHYLYSVGLLGKRLSLILLIYTLCRFCFLIFNLPYFSSLTFLDAIVLFLYGIRFDLASVIYLDMPVILLHTIPGNFKQNKTYQIITFILYFIVNAAAISLNMSDVEYFKYSNKRSTADLFSFMTTGDDFITQLPRFMIDFWYLLLILLCMMVGLWYFYPGYKKNTAQQKNSVCGILLQTGLMLSVLFAGVLIARGTRYKPLRIISVFDYTSAHNAPLVLNTPFTIINSIGHEEISNKEYFPPEKLSSVYTTKRHYKSQKEFIPDNVVIFILESFSREYVGFITRNKTATPFLDSLFQKSFVCTNAYANATKSNEAIPAVIASLPAMTNVAYISSKYSSNEMHSLAHALKEKNYRTSFFHGGKNGTMSFDYFTKLAGFDQYFGKNEYNNDADFDGKWGIFDEPFLQFFAKELDKIPAPFFSVLFTLSSHHPYTIPEKYEKMLANESSEIRKSIRYTDFALKQFFKTASKSKWFNNTLFVFVADHTTHIENKEYQNEIGIYSIPIAFYHPSDTTLTGQITEVVQQIDIMPSILDYLGYDNAFPSFGYSMFDENAPRFAINYKNGIYEMITDSLIFHFDGESKLKINNWKTEKIFTGQSKQTHNSTQFMKALLQTYNSKLSRNELYKTD